MMQYPVLEKEFILQEPNIEAPYDPEIKEKPLPKTSS